MRRRAPGVGETKNKRTPTIRIPRYVVKIKEVDSGNGKVWYGQYMVMHPTGRQVTLPGVQAELDFQIVHLECGRPNEIAAQAGERLQKPRFIDTS
jgi:hypothetical protein